MCVWLNFTLQFSRMHINVDNINNTNNNEQKGIIKQTNIPINIIRLTLF